MAKVNIDVEAQATGEDAFDRQADGLNKVKTSAEGAELKLIRLNTTNLSVLAGLRALHGGVIQTTMGLQQLGINSGIAHEVMIKLNAITSIATGTLMLYKAAEIAATSATWGRVAAMIASHGFLAPAVVAVIAGALASLIALKAVHMMARGGSGIVSEPTLFLAGEHGRESYSFTPLGGSSTSNSSFVVNIFGNADRDRIFELENRLRTLMISRGV